MWLPTILLASSLLIPPQVGQASLPEVPVKGMVTMIDLGAKKCIPCKMMAPILEKLKGQYEGKASIVFIDVFEHRAQAVRFGIRTIPTQIFFDRDGKEVHRHLGFMSEEAIVRQLKRMGVDPDKNHGPAKTDALHELD
jgi:thioredoxin 1